MHSVAGLIPARCGTAHDAAVQGAASHRQRCRAGRWRHDPAAWRNQPGASRRAVPRRDAGVQPARAGSAAPAARGRRGADCARRAHRDLPRRLHAGRRDESLPVRVCRRRDLRPCRCTPQQVERYTSRLSGPLRDRIDLAVAVAAVPPRDLHGDAGGEGSAAIRDARGRGARPSARHGTGRSTRGWKAAGCARACGSMPPSRTLLEKAVSRLTLSARAFDRVLRVARTIADLAQSDAVDRRAPRRGAAVSRESLSESRAGLSPARSSLSATRGQLRARVGGVGEIGLQLQRARERASARGWIAGLQVRESEVIVVDRILRRTIARPLERGNRLRRQPLLQIDPARACPRPQDGAAVRPSRWSPAAAPRPASPPTRRSRPGCSRRRRHADRSRAPARTPSAPPADPSSPPAASRSSSSRSPRLMAIGVRAPRTVERRRRPSPGWRRRVRAARRPPTATHRRRSRRGASASAAAQLPAVSSTSALSSFSCTSAGVAASHSATCARATSTFRFARSAWMMPFRASAERGASRSAS